MKVLITTVPFAEKDRQPLKMLEDSKIKYLINPLNRKLTESELIEMLSDYDALIAGTEKISQTVINSAPKLKHISRVGIGLDNVDLLAAKEKGIKVSYTPDVPAPAIAELTIAMMLSLLRSTHVSNDNMHKGKWLKVMGRRLAKVKIGLIGIGRVSTLIIKYLQAFESPTIFANDISEKAKNSSLPVNWVTKDKIFKEADVISLHLPLTKLTKNLIKKEHLMSMKKDAMIINTSRGGIINEKDLYEVMKTGHLSGAAIDVFEQEPYNGPLIEIERCLMTSHMGSMSLDCRVNMEIEATEETIRFFNRDYLKREVPVDEYKVQQMSL